MRIAGITPRGNIMGAQSAVIVTTSLYQAALSFSALKDIRYYLNGVYIEAAPDGDGNLLVATDGHCLAVIRDREQAPIASPVILPTVKIQAADRKPGRLLTFDGATCRTDSGVSMPAPYVDGRFPDFRMVVPRDVGKAGEMKVSAFNPDFLARLDSLRGAFQHTNPKHFAACIHYSRLSESTALVTFNSGVDAFVVMMPVRGNIATPSDITSWIDRTPASAIAA